MYTQMYIHVQVQVMCRTGENEGGNTGREAGKRKDLMKREARNRIYECDQSHIHANMYIYIHVHCDLSLPPHHMMKTA